MSPGLTLPDSEAAVDGSERTRKNPVGVSSILMVFLVEPDEVATFCLGVGESLTAGFGVVCAIVGDADAVGVGEVVG